MMEVGKERTIIMAENITRFSLSLPDQLVRELDLTAAGEAAANPGHRVSRNGLIERYIREGMARDSGKGDGRKS
jgi:metal-responsive CopG/Arc/MetJ family transcriptional regulator